MGSVVTVRARLPEGRNRGHDQPRVASDQRRKTEPESLQIAGCAILDEDVGPVHQLLEEPAPRLACEIEGDGALARVEVEEERAALRVWDVVAEGTSPARGIAAVRGLQLDDVGTEIGEQLCAVGSGHHLAEFEHSEPREGTPAGNRRWPGRLNLRQLLRMAHRCPS